MVRIPTPQVAETSLDAVGISVTVAHRRINDPRYGAAYDNATLAAAVPVYFHPLSATEYVMLFSRRWHTATPAADNPSAYLSHVEDTSPGWVKLMVPSGMRSQIGTSLTIPVGTSHTAATLIDASSLNQQVLFTLVQVNTQEQIDSAVAYWHYNTTTGSLSLVAEEKLPRTAAIASTVTDRAWAAMDTATRLAEGIPITFTAGLQATSQHLEVYGTDTAGRVFVARKPWGRIGINTVATPGDTYGQSRSTPDDPRWTYWTGTGWTTDWSLLAPLTTIGGDTITTLAPVSVISFQDRTWMATVEAQGDTRRARVYTQRGSRGWTAESTTIDLGNSASFVDGLRFQPQLRPTGTTAENATSLVYVYTTLQDDGTTATLNNTWGVWGVPLVIKTTDAEAPTALNALTAVTATPTADVY